MTDSACGTVSQSPFLFFLEPPLDEQETSYFAASARISSFFQAVKIHFSSLNFY
jgi:hypothetical protein